MKLPSNIFIILLLTILPSTLVNAKVINGCAIKPRTQCPGANLAGANLRSANLRGANLAGANLQGANLTGAQLSGATLAHATITHAKINYANLREANLKEAVLNGSKIINSKLRSANLQYASLKKVNLKGSSLKYADLYGADLTGSNLTKTNFSGAILTSAIMLDTLQIKTNLKGVIWASADPGRESTGGGPTGGDGKTALLLSVPGVSDNMYSKMTIMNPTVLKSAQADTDLQEHHYSLARILNFFIETATAATTSCSGQLVGLKKEQETWEVLKLTQDGKDVCAINIISLNDYVLVTLEKTLVNTAYCNMLIMRKVDGKLYCGLESAPIQYDIESVNISSNGKYSAINATATPYSSYPGGYGDYLDGGRQYPVLLRMALKSWDGNPNIAMIWADPNAAFTASGIDDAVPTNSGDAVMFTHRNGIYFAEYVQVNWFYNDPLMNTRYSLVTPWADKNVHKLLPTADWNKWTFDDIHSNWKLRLIPDPSDRMNSALIVEDYWSTTDSVVGRRPGVVRVNAPTPGNPPQYDFLGYSTTVCGVSFSCWDRDSFKVMQGVVKSLLPLSDSYWSHNYTTKVSYRINKYPEFQSLSDLQFSNNNLTNCTVGMLSLNCSTDVTLIPSISVCDPYPCKYGENLGNTSVFWDMDGVWLASTENRNNFKYKHIVWIDDASKMAKHFQFQGYVIDKIDVSYKYPGTLLVQGIDLNSGLSGSRFVARIAKDGSLYEKSMIPDKVTVNPITMVELGS